MNLKKSLNQFYGFLADGFRWSTDKTVKTKKQFDEKYKASGLSVYDKVSNQDKSRILRNYVLKQRNEPKIADEKEFLDRFNVRGPR